MSQLSYYRNTQKFNFIYETIGTRIRHWAKTQPSKIALVVHMDQERRAVLTFGELYDKAVKLAKYYLSLGVKPGDRIAVFVYNSPEWLVASVACFLAGAVAVNSATFSAEADLDMVCTIGCKVLVADMREATVKTFLIDNIIKLKQKGFAVSVITVDAQNTAPSQNSVSFDHVLSSHMSDDVVLPDGNDPEEIATVFQTSGSTGVPKFVPYSHVQIINNLNILYSEMGVTNEDIFFSDRPLGYMAGYPAAPIATGCTFVTLNSQSTVRDSLVRQLCKILKDEAVTSAFMPSYIVYDLEKFKLSSTEQIPTFKSIITGGQRLSKKVLLQFTKYARKACLGYGTTESGWCTCTDVADLPDVDDDLIGIPFPDKEIKIIGENGQVVPVNTVGEICLRSVCVMGKYLKLGGETVSCLDDKGWLHTGDTGFMLGDGKNICIKGRMAEIIKRSTIKIFPASIESILSKHPAVAGVVVVGIPDKRLYQEVCACVTVKDGEKLTNEELEAFAFETFRPDTSPDGKGLMPGHFFIFNSFPQLPSQKVNRLKVAEMAEELAQRKG